MTISLIFVGGIIAGLYGSAAGGGGLISFPLLVLLGFSTPTAVATNRFAAVILETVSAVRFFREGVLLPSDLRLGTLLGLTAAVGSTLGSLMVIAIPEAVLNIVTGTFLFAITCYLLLKKPLSELEERKLTSQRMVFLHAAAFCLGIYGGILGAGMGTIFTVLLVGSGLTYLHSSAVARLSGIFWSFAATVVFAFSGTIDWMAGLALGGGFALGGWIGAGLGARKGERYIRFLLLAVVFASIGKLLLDAAL